MGSRPLYRLAERKKICCSKDGIENKLAIPPFLGEGGGAGPKQKSIKFPLYLHRNVPWEFVDHFVPFEACLLDVAKALEH